MNRPPGARAKFLEPSASQLQRAPFAVGFSVPLKVEDPPRLRISRPATKGEVGAIACHR